MVLQSEGDPWERAVEERDVTIREQRGTIRQQRELIAQLRERLGQFKQALDERDKAILDFYEERRVNQEALERAQEELTRLRAISEEKLPPPPPKADERRGWEPSESPDLLAQPGPMPTGKGPEGEAPHE